MFQSLQRITQAIPKVRLSYKMSAEFVFSFLPFLSLSRVCENTGQ